MWSRRILNGHFGERSVHHANCRVFGCGRPRDQGGTAQRLASSATSRCLRAGRKVSTAGHGRRRTPRRPRTPAPAATGSRALADRNRNGRPNRKILVGAADGHQDLRRIDAIMDVLQEGRTLSVDANSRFDLETAIACAQAQSSVRSVLVRGTGRPAGLRTARHAPPARQEPGDHRRGLVLPAARAQLDPLRWPAPPTRLAAI